ncbi:MAG: glycine betaine/L-proline ABC transporter ATP-binding protein [Roseovarius sp.]|jgi:glycine betaine/proline transport system ATP-binding protein|uniref:quaternary amine ABC transporter ATP-binding protein n=1 Tax=unclassified Roseovarius TaxID=2614913 RepID=UPI00273F28CB|nr:MULTISPECIES: glycine betaine/L-proline ABC transporter ATP-binding protein [unclassified Roseovarius]
MQHVTAVPSSQPGLDPSPVKLSCRGLWKVFGANPEDALKRTAGAATRGDRISAVRSAGQMPAVCDVGFDVREGEIFVLMGLSGSGKSTVLRCLSRLVEPTAGEVILDGQNLVGMDARSLTYLRRHKMGMVFQSFGLMPHLTVLENVAFPLKIQGVAAQERLERAREVVSLVGLEGRETASPDELSGGQQQRVGIARSLAVNPDLWFLDEPFSALDPLIRGQMQDEFMRLQSQLGKTIVFVTHDFLEALKIADRIAIMKDGQVVQLGRPSELVLAPADDYVRSFTADVPLVRVLKVSDVMEPAADRTGAAFPVAADATLEDLFAMHDFGAGDVPVRGRDGTITGRVTPSGVASVLHRAMARGTNAPGAGARG